MVWKKQAGMGRREVIGLLGGSAALAAAGPAFAQAEPPKPAQIVVNHSGGSMGSARRMPAAV